MSSCRGSESSCVTTSVQSVCCWSSGVKFVLISCTGGVWTLCLLSVLGNIILPPPQWFLQVWTPCSSFICWCDKSLRWIQRLHDGSEIELHHQQIILFYSQHYQLWNQLLLLIAVAKCSTTRTRRSCGRTSCLTPPERETVWYRAVGHYWSRWVLM